MDDIKAKLATAAELLCDHQECAGPLGREHRRKVASFLATLDAPKEAM